MATVLTGIIPHLGTHPKTALVVGFSRDETTEAVMRGIGGYEKFLYAPNARKASQILQGDRVSYVQMNLQVVRPDEEQYLGDLLKAARMLVEVKVELEKKDDAKSRETLERLNTPEGQRKALYALIKLIRGEVEPAPQQK